MPRSAHSAVAADSGRGLWKISSSTCTPERARLAGGRAQRGVGVGPPAHAQHGGGRVGPDRHRVAEHERAARAERGLQREALRARVERDVERQQHHGPARRGGGGARPRHVGFRRGHVRATRGRRSGAFGWAPTTMKRMPSGPPTTCRVAAASTRR